MTKPNKVLRFHEIQEFRALEPTEESGHIVEGYAIIYEERTNVGGWFMEIIKRGALDGADLKDVPLFIHHQDRKIPLARSRNNNGNSTMQLTVDNKGLHFRAELDVENNSEAKALYSAVKREDITGMSFAFRTSEENWSDLDEELPTREIIKYEKIYEISALYSPQYDGANINARDESLDSEDKAALDNAKSESLDNDQNEKDLELRKAIEMELINSVN
ncbi:HK97 family phage prohead protease [Salipaludibacillus sp. HK11]|uniref:HK97 family phage prohead protease n=1 Tax=Salipaludibacillus sp. HK11 TaxID=3394320 RepID=UPI0039FD4F3B